MSKQLLNNYYNKLDETIRFDGSRNEAQALLTVNRDGETAAAALGRMPRGEDERRAQPRQSLLDRA